MCWWRAMLPRRPNRSPNRSSLKAPAPPVGAFFLGRSKEKARPQGDRAFLCVPAPTPVPVPPKKTTARKSIVGEFARMAGLGRRIGQSEILIDRAVRTQSEV